MLAYDLPSLFWGSNDDKNSLTSAKSFVKEDESSYLIKFEVPGVDLKDVQLEVTESRLTLLAQREGEDGFSTQFESVYKLPKTIDRENVSAKLDKGILTVTIPKKSPDKPERINVSIEG